MVNPDTPTPEGQSLDIRYVQKTTVDMDSLCDELEVSRRDIVSIAVRWQVMHIDLTDGRKLEYPLHECDWEITQHQPHSMTLYDEDWNEVRCSMLSSRIDTRLQNSVTQAEGEGTQNAFMTYGGAECELVLPAERYKWSFPEIAKMLEPYPQGDEVVDGTEFTDRLADLLDKLYDHHEYTELGDWVHKVQADEWAWAESMVRQLHSELKEVDNG